MKKILYKKINILGLVILLASCNSFLDETPDARTEIDSPEKVQELLVGAYPDALYMDMC